MIEKVTVQSHDRHLEASPAPPNQKVLRHTPFGDVMVDELATTDVFGLCSRGEETSAPLTRAPEAPAQATATAPSVPTAEAVFGERPWMDSPRGAGEGATWSYNPLYFATRQTAEKVAAILGGRVVERNALTPFGPLRQLVPNLMVELPDGHLVNAGLVADLYNHGHSQARLDALLELERRGA